MTAPFVVKPQITREDDLQGRRHIWFTTEANRLRTNLARRLITDATGTEDFLVALDEMNQAFRVGPSESELSQDFLRRLRNWTTVLTVVPLSGWPLEAYGFALDWHQEPGPEGSRTVVGEAEYQAKWFANVNAAESLRSRMAAFVETHAALQRTSVVVGIASSHSLSPFLSRGLATALGVRWLECNKSAGTGKQSERGAAAFADLLSAPEGTLELPPVPAGARVLIVDDLYRSGGTIREVCACLARQGISSVFWLTATKSIQFHRKT